MNRPFALFQKLLLFSGIFIVFLSGCIQHQNDKYTHPTTTLSPIQKKEKVNAFFNTIKIVSYPSLESNKLIIRLKNSDISDLEQEDAIPQSQIKATHVRGEKVSTTCLKNIKQQQSVVGKLATAILAPVYATVIITSSCIEAISEMSKPETIDTKTNKNNATQNSIAQSPLQKQSNRFKHHSLKIHWNSSKTEVCHYNDKGLILIDCRADDFYDGVTIEDTLSGDRYTLQSQTIMQKKTTDVSNYLYNAIVKNKDAYTIQTYAILAQRATDGSLHNEDITVISAFNYSRDKVIQYLISTQNNDLIPADIFVQYEWHITKLSHDA